MVNWSVFDMDPNDDKSDVSRKQVLEEYAKYDGSPSEFARELDKRFGYSGMMCEIVEDWCTQADKEGK